MGCSVWNRESRLQPPSPDRVRTSRAAYGWKREPVGDLANIHRVIQCEATKERLRAVAGHLVRKHRGTLQRIGNNFSKPFELTAAEIVALIPFGWVARY